MSIIFMTIQHPKTTQNMTKRNNNLHLHTFKNLFRDRKVDGVAVGRCRFHIVMKYIHSLVQNIHNFEPIADRPLEIQYIVALDEALQ